MYALVESGSITKILKGNKGINLKKPKYLISEIEYFFSEDQGRYIVEINQENFKKVEKILHDNSVHFDELGVVNDNKFLFSDEIDLSIEDLIKAYKNWFKKYMVN